MQFEFREVSKRISQYVMYLYPYPYNIRNLIFLSETIFIGKNTHIRHKEQQQKKCKKRKK